MAIGDSPIEVHWGKSVICEVLGTAFVVFIGLSSVAVNGNIAVAHAFGEGFGYFFSLLMFILFGSGHFNPAVTLVKIAMVFFSTDNDTRTFPWYYLIFFVAQYVGSLIGALLVWAITADRTFTGLGMPVLGGGVTVGTGFVTEIILTTILVFVYCMTEVIIHKFGSDKANGKEFIPHFVRALAISFAIIALIFTGHTISGANLNPFRFLGPATIAVDAGPNFGVYVWPPFIGAIIAFALVYLLMWLAGALRRGTSTSTTKHRNNKVKTLKV